MDIDILAPFEKILEDVVNSAPTVLGFIVFVLIAFFAIKIFLWIIRKALSKTNIDQWSEKLSETEIFGDTTVNVVLTKVILGVLKWFLIIIFVMAGSEMFGLTVVSGAIKSFFSYLPRLITALLIFVAGVYVGTTVKKQLTLCLNLLKFLEET